MQAPAAGQRTAQIDNGAPDLSIQGRATHNPGLDQQGKWAQCPGLDHLGRRQEESTRPPGLEHPEGRGAKKRHTIGLEHPQKTKTASRRAPSTGTGGCGPKPRTGSSRDEGAAAPDWNVRG